MQCLFASSLLYLQVKNQKKTKTNNQQQGIEQFGAWSKLPQTLEQMSPGSPFKPELFFYSDFVMLNQSAILKDNFTGLRIVVNNSWASIHRKLACVNSNNQFAQ